MKLVISEQRIEHWVTELIGLKDLRKRDMKEEVLFNQREKEIQAKDSW